MRIEMPSTKKNVIILNCCHLGESEREFWNSLFLSFSDTHHFTFLSTTAVDGIKADKCLQIRYEFILFPNCPENPSAELTQLIQRVADKQRIWDSYQDEESLRLAYSWLITWTMLLRTIKPDFVIAWNGHHLPEAALKEICDIESVDFIYAERGPLAGTFSLDKLGVNCQSSFNLAYDKIAVETSIEKVLEFKNLYFGDGNSNWMQPERSFDKQQLLQRFNIPEGKKIIFFPGQVDRDINSKLFSPHFNSTFDAFSNIVEWCNKNSDDVFLLAKKHPMQEPEQANEELEIASGVWVEDIHIFDCIELCDVMVSINSSSAVEAALAEKPLLLLGDSILRHAENVIHIGSRAELDISLKSLVTNGSWAHATLRTEFFSKLLFGYLFTAKEEFVKCGVQHVSRFSPPHQTDAPIEKGIVEVGVNLLETIAPTLGNAVVQNKELASQLEEVSQQLRSINQNFLVSLLKRFRLI